jgi:hypothetical protein
MVELAVPKEGRGESFYTIPQKLAVENEPLEIGTSDF